MVKKLLLNFYIWPLFVIVTIVALLLVPILWIGNSLTLKIPENRALRKGIRIYGCVLVRVMPFFAPVRLQDRSGGRPQAGIYVANHNSAVDPYCFGVLPGEYAFFTSWPFFIPVYNLIMKKAQYLNAARGWDAVLKKSIRLLENGCSLIIWPEGHRSRNGELGKFENGAFRLACESGYPIVPVCITGTNLLMSPGCRLLTPAKVQVTILPPHYPPGGLSDRGTVQELNTRVKEVLARELQRQSND